jgi:serine/threonine-protein kinase
MGTVYAVTHAEIGKQAALKVVHRRVLNPGDEDRMRLEAQVVNLVGHPNIVDIFETGHLPDKRPYLVMERLEGVSLAQRAEEGKLLPDQVISILLQVCDALIAAHATGIIHRDLKLDNVFLIDNPDDPKRPRAKILDWGIAKVIAEHAKSTRHTIDGQLIGTPQYLSPEQARGGELTEKTDVYSLGVMAYELFLEQLPFEAETAAEIMTMHLRAVPPPASEAWPDIPTELEDLIHSMLAKNPLHRPTMLEVARKLEVVREELDRRRSQPITLPKVATGAAVEPAPIAEPLVVTQAPAVAKHRWQWFVGAAAVATCAMLLLVSQLVDSNAATASTLGDTPALLAPTPVEVAKPVIHKPTIAVNEPAAQPVVAPVVVEPKPVAKPTRQKPRYQLAPVAPRRNAKLDPDGTYDPYK